MGKRPTVSPTAEVQGMVMSAKYQKIGEKERRKKTRMKRTNEREKEGRRR
jgi:hypothetical protein